MSTSSLTNEELRRAIAGDHVARAALCLGLLPRIYGLARRVTGRADVAEEAAQEAILRVLRGLGDVRDPASVESWALTVAGNVARNLVGRARKSQPLDDEGPPAPAESRPGPDGVRQAALDAAVATLAPADRELFILHTVEGVPLRRLARDVDTNENAMKQRLHRIRAKVRSRALDHLARAGGPRE